MSAALSAKALIIALAIADIAGTGWFSNLLTTGRPSAPQGAYVVPFQTHGGVTYISQAESRIHIALLLSGVLVVLAWWLVTRFEKTARTS